MTALLLFLFTETRETVDREVLARFDAVSDTCKVKNLIYQKIKKK